MDKPKVNKMMEIAMQNKAFRERYQNRKEYQQKISVTFLKNKENIIRDREIEMIMEWFSNQRFPEM